uniref:Superoxide dismutase [Cu-Zn] n=1 Tax=Plectus sambesii TaxID=2011161 RepID=A0A914V9S8_9BILA
MGGYLSKEAESSMRAVALIKGEKVQGSVWFSQETLGGATTIKGEIKGLSPGLHGFHVHQYGDMSNGCTSAGPHLNPFEMTHGGPKDSVRHMGDLGNVQAGADGVAKIDMTDHQLQLFGPHSIVGRSIVVHADTDDLGRGEGNKKDESKKTGNSGDRLGCGVIALAAPE